ncbi:trypsin-like peptidase domain-containing protein [Borrelia persica]|uniref:trypsin-like peptidase domain-containing protein n=1 Tax=Borrelia persica TaxID=44448 RepID=UPI000466044F|nr:trypsin-like peptidase domain-containing protein [Borrelia persica]
MNKNFISVFVASFLALAIGFFVGIGYLQSNKNTIVFAQEKGDAVHSLQDSFRKVSRKVLPSTVEIYATGTIKTRDAVPPFFFFFDIPGLNLEKKAQWGGSGVVIGKDSKKTNLFYVLTNSHILENASEFEVGTYNNKSYKAQLVGKDDKKDIALVSFEAADADIGVAELGDSDKLEVGDWVIAVGSPYNYSFSVTAGIISGLHRSFNPNLKARNLFIQTDAAINRGNSGGPLVNIHGEVVGINSWISTTSGGSIGLGFAIPINNAKSVFDALMSGQKSESAWMGVAFHRLKSKDTEFLKSLGYEDESMSLAIVAGIYDGSPALKAGFRAGDVINKINGVTMNLFVDVKQYINDFYAKEKIKVEVLRGQETKTFDVELGVMPISSDKEKVNVVNLKLIPGFTVYPLTKEVRIQLGLRNWINGVVVDHVDQTLAANSQIATGDIIMIVNSKNIKTLRDFYDALQHGKNNYSILRNGQTLKMSF